MTVTANDAGGCRVDALASLNPIVEIPYSHKGLADLDGNAGDHSDVKEDLRRTRVALRHKGRPAIVALSGVCLPIHSVTVRAV